MVTNSTINDARFRFTLGFPAVSDRKTFWESETYKKIANDKKSESCFRAANFKKSGRGRLALFSQIAIAPITTMKTEHTA